MFSNVVVPADLTDRNRDAVAMAARLVNRDGGKVHLLHVIETIPGFSLEEEQDFYRKLEKAAGKHLAELAKPLEKEGIDFAIEVVYGSRARTVLEEANRIGADIIVIHSHRGSTDGKGEGGGTLSYQIGIFSDVPVLLVK